ncbi:MAG TPA: patatin-like phospholipase family protein [Chitinophagaceae bacterium]|nr:patatin-like phospholipase family protein [Chitinophagaceae bacterium]
MVRPRIGLALSGGGAKGLAHIGILKAIDSAGLKIDYITGTSMGSIIGGLYAVGYSADSIEKITRATNWELLLSNQSSLRTLYMEEKEEYNKYTIELPWVKNRFELPTGLLQGQEIWVKLAELLFPVYNQKDFSKFSVPFRCVATDVGNGEAVVLGKGELSSAIRASMAIPSLFTAVEYDGRKLIDGGVIRNFPVKDVQELGADFVIGSNAAQTLLPSDKVRNAIQVLLQVAFFHEAQDHKEEIAKCDIYVSPDLSKYNMVSFGQSGEILDAGIAEGRKLYPKLKKLVDSLDAIYGKQAETKKQLPVVKSVIISSCEVKGLKNTNTDFFIHTINFLTNQAYTSQKLSKMVRAAFGTRYYSRIVYSLEPQSDGTCKIIFDVTENPLTFAKFGLHYNRFSGIAAIVNVTSRNLLLPNSRSLVTLNIGEAIRARAEHLQYIGRRKNFSFLLGMQYDRFNVLTYNTYKQDGLYKQQFFKADIKAQFSTQRNLTIGIGHRVESVKYKPKIIPAFQFSGSNIFGSTYFFIQHNSLDKIIYPGNGIRINSTFEYVGNQHPSVSFFINGIPVRSDSLKVSKKPYTRATFNMDAYKQLSRRTTAEFLIQSGINFNYSNNIMNEFVIGGLTRQFRNQVLFAGLLEGSLYSPAVAAIQTGLRYEVLNNTFVTCRGNILFNNFISKSDFFSNPDVATGYSVTFGYNFALGPLEFSLMYNDQSKKVNGYVNIGIVF